MKLEELVKLKEGDVIRCGACGCDGEEYVIEFDEGLSCGCQDICHSESPAALVLMQCAQHRKERPYYNCEVNAPFITLEDGRVACWNAIPRYERDTIILVRGGA